MGIKTRLIIQFFLIYIISLVIFVSIASEIIYKSQSIWQLENLDKSLKQSIDIFNKAKKHNILNKKFEKEYQELILKLMREHKQKEVFRENIIRNLIVKLLVSTFPFFLLIVLYFYVRVDQLINPLKRLSKRMSVYPLKSLKLKKKAVSEVSVLIDTFNHMIEQIKDYEQKLEAEQRITGWLEMSRAVVHEINNFILPIERSLVNLEKGIDQDNENNITMARNALNNIKELIFNMKRFYKVSSQVNKRIDIIKELHYICNGFDIICNNNTGLDKIFNTLHRLEFNELIINLIKNGFEAVPSDREPEIKVEVSLMRKKMQISIKDNGTGINKKDHKKIFQPSFSTKRKGMGLGLAIVHRIIIKNNWKLRIISEVNKGTFFIVSIPIKGR